MSNEYISLHALPPLTSLLGTNQVMILLPVGNDGSQGTTSTIAGTTLDALSTFFNAGVQPLLGKALNEADLYSDFVVNGLTTPQGATLTATLTAGSAYVLGTRVTLAAAVPYTYLASSDTYVDLSDTGVLTYVPVSNGAAAPAITANSLRLEKVVTNATDVISVSNLQPRLVQIWQNTKVTILDSLNSNGFMLGAGNVAVSGTFNTGIGLGTQFSLTSGATNTAIGFNSQHLLSTGTDNCAIGYNTQQSLSTGYGNNALGSNAQISLTTGFTNTAVGNNAQLNLTTGYGNNAFGGNAQHNLTTGTDNSAFGDTAQSTINIGSYNSAFGAGAQSNITSGVSNCAFGFSAQNNLVTGQYNVAVGDHAQSGPVTGNYNVAVGASTQSSLTTGTQNIALGYNTQPSLTTGNQNVTLGSQSHNGLTTGSFNTGVGDQVHYSLISGSSNSAVGQHSLYYGRYGSNNATLGASTLYSLFAGSQNTALGFGAMSGLGYVVSAGSFIVGRSYAITYVGTTNFTLIGSADNNLGTVFTATGVGTGNGSAANADANNNVAVGYNTGAGIVTGMGNTILGSNVSGLAADLSYNIILADGNGNQRINVTATGNVGFGVSAATAVLQLKAGGTQPSTGPMKFTAGSLLTTPEAGSEESDSLNARYFTDSTGTRQRYQTTDYTTLPSAITVGASPFIYQNSTGAPGDALISGGTVTLIEFSRDGTNWFSTGTQVGFTPLSPLDRVRVTYTAAPNMTFIPR